MDKYSEIVVPQGFPISGIRAFASMLPDDMGGVRDAISLMCDGAEFDTYRIISSANEQNRKMGEEFSANYVKAACNIDGVPVKPSDYILDDGEWYEVIAVSDIIVVYEGKDGLVCIDPSNSETRV